MKSGFLSRALFSNWAPTVLVLASEEVDNACRKNGPEINFLSLLKCFTVLKDNIAYKLIREGKQVNRANFTLSFVTPQQLQDTAASSTQAKNPFPMALLQSPVTDGADRLKVDSLNKTISLLCAKTIQTPWYFQYCKEFIGNIASSPHEVFLHPVCLLLATSYLDPNPQQTFQQQLLAAKKRVPHYMDLEVLKIYMIVHDESVPTDDKTRQQAAQRFKDFRTQILPSKCYVLTLNGKRRPNLVQVSSPTEQSTTATPNNTNSTAPENSSSTTSNNCGMEPTLLSLSSLSAFPFAQAQVPPMSYMTESNFESISGAVALLITDNIIAYMQQTIANLNQEVINHRSGIKHKWNIWFGKSPSKKDEEHALRFELASLEFLQRRLADWAYMLEDYWLAHKTYKSLYEVYHSEGAVLWEAGAQEMQALSAVMMAIAHGVQPAGNEELELLATAMESYYKQGNLFHYKRCQLYYSYTCSDWLQYYDQASLYYAGLANHETNPLMRALFHEQAAINYLQMIKPSHRKYAFQQVLAGQSYGKINLLAHAQRCLLNGYAIYVRHPWSALNDHLNFSLSRLSYILDNVPMAAEMMNRLLASNNQNAFVQNEYLREFLFIFSVAIPNLLVQKAQHDQALSEEQAQAGLTIPTLQLPNTNSNLENSASKKSVSGNVSPRSNGAKSPRAPRSPRSPRGYSTVPNPSSPSTPLSNSAASTTSSATTTNANLSQQSGSQSQFLPSLFGPESVYDSPLPHIDPRKVKLHVRDDNEPLRDTNNNQNNNSSHPSGNAGTSSLANSTKNAFGSHSGHPNAASNHHHHNAVCTPQKWEQMITDAIAVTYPKEKRGMATFLRKQAANKGQQAKIAVVDEKFFIEVELHNPLRVPVQLTEMRLKCEHREKKNSPPDANSTQENDAFVTESYNILLAPLHTSKFMFSIVPLKQGFITMKGISFLLFGKIKGQKLFDISPSTSPSGKESEKDKAKNTLQVMVCPRMPLIDVCISGMQSQIRQGEVRQLQLNISNTGSIALSTLSLALSHPSFFSFEGPDQSPDLTRLFTPITQAEAGEEATFALHTVNVPLPGPLEPKETIQIPLWFRVGTEAHPGRLDCQFVFHYAPVKIISPELKFRLQKAVISVEVLPSLHMNTIVTASLTAANEYIVAVSVKNPTDQAIRLQGLTLISQAWSACRLEQSGDACHYTLSPSHSAQILLSIKNKLSSDVDEEEIALDASAIFKDDHPAITFIPLLQGHRTDSSQECHLDFLIREHVIRDFAKSKMTEQMGEHGMKMYLDGGEVADEKRIDKKKHDIAYAKLCQLLHLVLDWEFESNSNNANSDTKNSSSTNDQQSQNGSTTPSSNVVRVGHHHCLGLEIIADFEEKESIPLQSTWLENYTHGHSNKANIPLSFLLHAAQSVKHNFVDDGFCHVTTEVEIANLSSLDHVSVELEALNPIPFVPSPETNASNTVPHSPAPHFAPFNVASPHAHQPQGPHVYQQQKEIPTPTSLIQSATPNPNATANPTLLQQQQWLHSPTSMLATSSFNVSSNAACSSNRITSFYSGLSLHKLTLAPRERKQLTLCLTFVQPGVYNVNNFFLDITLVTLDERTLKIPYRPQVPHYVSVLQT